MWEVVAIATIHKFLDGDSYILLKIPGFPKIDLIQDGTRDAGSSGYQTLQATLDIVSNLGSLNYKFHQITCFIELFILLNYLFHY